MNSLPSRLGKKYYEAFLRWTIPGDTSRVSEKAMEATNLCHLYLLSVLLIPAFVLQYAFLGSTDLAIALTLAAAIMAPIPLVYKATGKLWIARELFILPLLGFKVWETVLFGGVVSPGTMWFIIPSIIAILLGSVRAAVIWVFVSIASIVCLHLVLTNNVVFLGDAVAHPHFMYVFNLVGLTLALAAFVLMVETSRKTAFLELEKANRTIREIAMRDPLTGIYNRRHVWAEIHREEALASKGFSVFCVCLIDLDKFKSINDTFGHPAGDDVLKAVATTIQSEVRHGDCFGRYGGEEFLLLLKDTRLEGARQFSERIRQRVEALSLLKIPALSGITISVGIAEYRQDEKVSKTLDRADKALYVAKSGGRNQVRMAA
jgi:diguanylate cyclase (GGDEF)-like protein